jgi:hypothetical protein
LARTRGIFPPELVETCNSVVVSYDDVREDAPDEIAAVENWIARVDGRRRNSLPSPAPPR